MKFYPGSGFGDEYDGDIFIAEHGSWNRSEPIGYRVMRMDLKAGGEPAISVFASGWFEGRTAWGRPVDVLQMSDGALLVSDDKTGSIYRIGRGP